MSSKLEATISANLSKFDKALEQGKSKIERFSKSVKALGATLAIGFAFGKVKEFVNELDALGKRAQDLNMTAGELKALSHEAEHAGLAVGEFDDAMKSFVEKIASASSGTGTEAEQLKKLGVSLTQTNGEYKTTNQLLYEVADAYKENAGGAESAKIACDLFGGSGVKMVRVLEQGSEALRAQVKDFESYNNAVIEASALNDDLKDASDTLGKLAVNVGSYLAIAFNVLSYGVRGKDYMEESLKRIAKKREEQEARTEARNQAMKRKAEEKALAEAEANLKELADAESESLTQREKENAEYQKAQAEVQKARLELIESERSDAEKILHLKSAIATQEEQLGRMQAGTTAYAQAELAILKNQKKLRDLEIKEKERLAQIEKERESKRQEALKKQKELSDKLLQLENARAKVIQNINQRNANARAETLENIGARAGNTGVGKAVNSAKSHEDKAQTALAQGRYSDYFRHSDQAKKQTEKAENRRREQMQNKIDSYEKLGNKEGANRLREEMNKEGFGKAKPEKEDIEKLKEIEEHTKETKDLLDKLLNGLEGE